MSPFIVGLTGGIGSGKTVCSDHFNKIGVPIIDTDVIAREIVQPGQQALKKLSETFGEKILLANGQLDRAALRDIAFSSSSSKAKLDAITHPAIRRSTINQISEVSYPYCIVVIPLLTADSVFSELLDRVLVVTADQETKIERVKTRSQLGREDVMRIMKTQLDDNSRLDFADDVVSNDRTIKDAQLAVDELHQRYLDLALSTPHLS